MKKIATMKDLEQVKGFVSRLKDEFDFDRLNAVVSLLEPSTYHYDVNLEVVDENSIDKRSEVIFKAYAHTTTGHDFYTKYGYTFHWKTSGGHDLIIRANVDDGEHSAEVYIGEEKSEYFYPTVRSLLERNRFDFVLNILREVLSC